MFEKIDNAMTELAKKAEKFYKDHPIVSKGLVLSVAMFSMYRRGYKAGYSDGYDECTEDTLCYYLSEAAKKK